MESQLPRTQAHHYEPTDLSSKPAGLNSGVEAGHSEGHQEKPSVLKKVKAKAKKLKHTLTKHGHDHDHDHDHEYEEDEDEEMVEDPEIHGAPIYESAAADKLGATRASGGQSATGGTNLDRPSMVGPHYDSPIFAPETRPFAQWQAYEDPGKRLLREDKQAPVPSKLLDTTTGSGEDISHELPHQGINTRTGRDAYETRENPDQIGGPNTMEGIRGGIGTTGFDVDPQGPNIRAHPKNVQAKTNDPAGRGSEEAEGITPVLKSFNKMGIYEEKPVTAGGLHTGSHTQFAPEKMPHESSDSVPKSDRGIFEGKPKTEQAGGLNTGSHDRFAPEPVPREISDSVPKIYNDANPQDMPDSVPKIYNDANPQDMPSSESSESFPKSYNAANSQDMPKDVSNPGSQSGTYTEKITSASAAASSAIAGTAQSAKNTVGSKIGQMREPGDDSKPGEGNKSGSVMGTAGDYTNRIAATVKGTLAPVYGKVVGVGSGATSKVAGLGADTTRESGGSAGQDKGVPGEDLGQMRKPVEGNKSGSVMGTAGDYANRIATSVTGTLAPVYGKVVGVGSGATSKVSELPSKVSELREGGGSVGQDKGVSGLGAKSTQESGGSVGQMLEPGEGNKSGSVMGTAGDYANRIATTVTGTLAPVYGKVAGVGSAATSKVSELGSETTKDSGGSVGQDKGVSVTEYWMEKLKPGEEDKALSSKITESFSKPKGEKMERVPNGGGGERSISQIVSDAVHKQAPEESKEGKPMGEVTESKEVAKRLGTGEEGTGLENVGSGGGVVSKFTGAIGSWLGGQGGRAQSTPGTTLADDNEGDMGKNNADAQGVTGGRRLQESTN